MKLSLLFLSLLLSAAAVQAGPPDPAAPSYEAGMAARSRGDYRGAKAIFLRLLEQTPDSNGALEGLALCCLSLGEYESAQDYLRRWDAKSPKNPYILGLLARAQRGLRDYAGAAAAYAEIVALDPADLATFRRLDSERARLDSGLFPSARIYKSLSAEGIGTPSPQRIVYEGRSGGIRGRARLSPRWALTGGIGFNQEAQRNDTGGFVYYDIFDQVYSLGLEADPSRQLHWEAEYGQSLIRDLHGEGVGRAKFSRARLFGSFHAFDTDARLSLTRAPKYLRGAGGRRYFSLLREDSARLELERRLLAVDWLARLGLDDYSEQTTYKTWSILGSQERGHDLFQARYAHGPQEFFGAAADGRLAYVTTDRWGARWRRLVEEKYLLAAGYGYTLFSDANRTHDFDTEVRGWLPRHKDFYGSYRFNLIAYTAAVDGYRSTNERNHWLGAYWRRGHGRGWWTLLGYEHGFLQDSRARYEGNSWLAETEWYRKAGLSLKAQGRLTQTTLRDQSYSLGLQARCSF
ncbi:MAG: tetratricopeptide repeat protein [Elusimicrobiota bacterium]|jgi:tetratricopeptide (TPR) repeat protein